MEKLFDFMLEQQRGQQLMVLQSAFDDAIRGGDEAAIAKLRPQWQALKAVDVSKAERPAVDATADQVRAAVEAALPSKDNASIQPSKEA